MEGVEAESGVRVAAGATATWHQSDLFVGGALFADDAVGLTGTIEETRLFCDRVTQWNRFNEMEVGIQKCGILEFCPVGEERILTEEHPERITLLVGNELVPIVEEYLYLGLRLTSALDMDSLISGRLATARKTAYAVTPFLRCSTVPIPLRLAIVQAVVLPRCLYGAEVFGMNRALTSEVQALVDLTLRSLLGLFGGKHWVPSAPLWSELGLLPVCAITAARRARAYRKCFQLTTTIGEIIRRPIGGRKWTWSSGIPRWIQRHCVPHALALHGEDSNVDWRQMDPRTISTWVQASIQHREQQLRLKASHRHAYLARWYYEVGKFGGSPLAKARTGVSPRDVRGVSLLIRARIGALRLAPSLVEAKKLPARYKTTCPCCQLPEPETLSHLLLTCPTWVRPRATQLGPVVEAAHRLGQQHASQSLSCPLDEARLSWILGGIQGGLRVRAWGGQRPSRQIVLNAERQEELSPEDRVGDSEASESESVTSRGSSSSSPSRGRVSQSGEGTIVIDPYIRVARFLRIVMHKRATMISALSDTPIGVLDITPATATGQRPDG